MQIMDGNCAWRDNVFFERRWRTAKYEKIYLRAHHSLRNARAGIAQDMDLFNAHRPDSNLVRSTPDATYRNLRPKSKQAAENKNLSLAPSRQPRGYVRRKRRRPLWKTLQLLQPPAIDLKTRLCCSNSRRPIIYVQREVNEDWQAKRNQLRGVNLIF